MRLTAIVPATDRPPTLARCLAGIGEAAEPPEQLILVEEPAGLGPAAARNLAARAAEGDVLVFVDSDVVVHEDAFARLRAAFARDDHLDAIFGAYDDDPPAPGAVSGFRNLLHHHVHAVSAGPAETFWAGLGAIRRSAFLDASGFDEERYPSASIEDVELGVRLSARGARIVLDPAVSGTHLKSWTLRQMVATDFARRGVPWVELLAERGGSTALNLGWRHRGSAAASVLLGASVLARRPRAAALAVAVLVALNRGFYVLLYRRRGGMQAVAGLGLHVVHHLTGAAAIPVGLARASTRRSPRRSRRPGTGRAASPG